MTSVTFSSVRAIALRKGLRVTLGRQAYLSEFQKKVTIQSVR